jgi:hypothetical protein
MKHNFTPDHLILHMYNEMLAPETTDLREALNHDEALQNVHQLLREGARLLPKASFSPSEESLQAILSYSQQSAVPTEC